MRSVTYPDMVNAEFRIAPGTATALSYTTIYTGSYNVGMNPEGSIAKNVNGSASLSN